MKSLDLLQAGRHVRGHALVAHLAFGTSPGSGVDPQAFHGDIGSAVCTLSVSSRCNACHCGLHVGKLRDFLFERDDVDIGEQIDH